MNHSGLLRQHAVYCLPNATTHSICTAKASRASRLLKASPAQQCSPCVTSSHRSSCARTSLRQQEAQEQTARAGRTEVCKSKKLTMPFLDSLHFSMTFCILAARLLLCLASENRIIVFFQTLGPSSRCWSRNLSTSTASTSLNTYKRF